MNPMVSVLMCNYNTNKAFLKEAIESILSQTFKDFEFIIVDDGSTDDSLAYIKEFKDDRIRILENKANRGHAGALNVGIQEAKGKYIARMDSDDISLPTRLEKQVAFMEANEGIIVSGTWFCRFDHRQKDICHRIRNMDEYRIHLLFSNIPAVNHTSAMYRADVFRKYNIKYRENYFSAEDYRLWVDASKYGDFKIVEEVLVRYRVHPDSMSIAGSTIMNEFVKKCYAEQLSKLNVELDDEAFMIHRLFLRKKDGYSDASKKWMKLLIKQNEIYNIYNKKLFKKMLVRGWMIKCINAFKQAQGKEKIKIVITMFPEIIPWLFYKEKENYVERREMKI